jgi:hypothetical protein
MALRAKVRHRWRSWLAIAILISVVGGLVSAATAAGRRTESAFPQFVDAHGFDAAVYSTHPVSKIARLPEVTSVIAVVAPNNGQPTCDCIQPISSNDIGVVVPSRRIGSVFKLVSGHLPDPSSPDLVLASFTLEKDAGLHLGSVIRVPFYSASQNSAVFSATGAPPKPRGPTLAFRVVGFEATENEFPSGGTPTYNLYATEAFARTVLPRIAVYYVYFVRLRDGAADLPRFDAVMSADGVEGYQNEDAPVASVEGSIHPQAIGWWILAGLAGLVGLAVIGQALARQSIVESEDYPTLKALGAERRQLFALSMLRNLVVGLAGAAGAVAVAVALSPLAPLGEARVAENSTGVAFDVADPLARSTCDGSGRNSSWCMAGPAGGPLRAARRPAGCFAPLRGGEPSGRHRCSTERGDRCPKRPGA